MAGFQLTHREDDVLQLVVNGLSNDEIASRLAISRRTVEAHMRALFRKMQVKSRSQLAAQYRQQADAASAASAASAARRDTGPEDWRLGSFSAAVRGLVDRQFPLFEERVELTIVVGEQDGQDAVIERRWTRPRPYLVYRIMGPILASGPDRPTEPDDLAWSCAVERQDFQAEVFPVVDVTGRMLVLILFQPGLDDAAEWVLRYRSPRLWRPLRETGVDTLRWATATLDQRHRASITTLTAHFVFPASWTDEQLSEENDLGVISRDELSSGQTQLTWHHDDPDAGAYCWTLRASPGAASPAQD